MFHTLNQRARASGVIAVCTLLLTDIDALTISAKVVAAGGAQSLAAQAIAVGILANCA